MASKNKAHIDTTSTSQKYSVREVRRFTPDRARSFNLPEAWLQSYVTVGVGPESVPRRLEAIISAWASKSMPISKRRIFLATLDGPEDSITRYGEADIIAKKGKTYSIIEVKSSISSYIVTEARKQIYYLGSLLHNSSDSIKGCTIFLDMNESSKAKLSLDTVNLSKASKYWTNLKERNVGFVSVITFSARDVWNWGVSNGIEKSFDDFNTYSKGIQREPKENGSKRMKVPQESPVLDGRKYMHEAVERLFSTPKACGVLFNLAEKNKLSVEELREFISVYAFDISTHERDLSLGFLALKRVDLFLELERSNEITKRFFNSVGSRDRVFESICDTLDSASAKSLIALQKITNLSINTEDALRCIKNTQAVEAILNGLVTSESDLHSIASWNNIILTDAPVKTSTTIPKTATRH